MRLPGFLHLGDRDQRGSGQQGGRFTPHAIVDQDAERLKKTSNSITHISQHVSAAAGGLLS
jgi:hypothetical protein